MGKLLGGIAFYYSFKLFFLTFTCTFNVHTLCIVLTFCSAQYFVSCPHTLTHTHSALIKTHNKKKIVSCLCKSNKTRAMQYILVVRNSCLCNFIPCCFSYMAPVGITKFLKNCSICLLLLLI